VQAGAIPTSCRRHAIRRHDRRGRSGCLGRGLSAEQIRANPLVNDRQRHKAERPFRLACIQLATYDGTVYNARYPEKIGHLCDYVLGTRHGSAATLHPLFEDHSPMRLNSGRRCRVCFTQSVQGAERDFPRPPRSTSVTIISGASTVLSSTSGSRSLLMHARLHLSILCSSLEVTAKAHEGKAGEMLWDCCIGSESNVGRSFANLSICQETGRR
jgi:arginine/lysine/ornithine decarboxylase